MARTTDVKRFPKCRVRRRRVGITLLSLYKYACKTTNREWLRGVDISRTSARNCRLLGMSRRQGTLRSAVTPGPVLITKTLQQAVEAGAGVVQIKPWEGCVAVVAPEDRAITITRLLASSAEDTDRFEAV